MPNYSSHPSKLSSEDIVQIVSRYRNDESSTSVSLAVEYGCSAVVICKHLRKYIPQAEYTELKLLRNPTHPGKEIVAANRAKQEKISYEFRHRVNHSAFASPLNESKAYWIGFLLADGCVSNGRIGLELNRRDLKHIAKFQDFVDGHFYNIRPVLQNNSYSLRFVSHRMANDLAVYGVIPRKSLTSDFAENIPDKLLPHYLRGFFDGDGSFHVDSRPRWVVQLPGSESFCAQLMKCLKKHGIYSIGPYVQTKTKMSVVQVHSENARTLLDWMHEKSDDSMRLDRKYEKFQLAASDL